MRDIKFRTWHIRHKQMIEPRTIPEMSDKGYWYSNSRNEIVFLQYTGLKDKNGKEIYEGDILRINDGGTAKVVWVERYLAYYIEWLPNRHGVALSLWTHKELEAIGNIYENPELKEATP